MNAMSFPSPTVIVISDDEEESGWVQLDTPSREIPIAPNTPNTSSNNPIIIDSVNDLPLPPPSSGYRRPMTTEFDWDEDDDSVDSWYESDEGEYDLLNDPLIQQMSVMVESEMEDRVSISYSEHDEGSTIVSTTSDAVDQLRADIQQRIDSGTIHRGWPSQPTVPVVPNPVFHEQPTFAGSLPHITQPPRSGHIFFAPSAQILPDSPESPPLSEQGQFDDAMDTLSNHGTSAAEQTSPPTPPPNTITSPIPWDIVPDEELANTCVICGKTYWNVLLEAAALYEAETSYSWERADTKLAKRNAFHYGPQESSRLHNKRGSVTGGHL